MSFASRFFLCAWNPSVGNFHRMSMNTSGSCSSSWSPKEMRVNFRRVLDGRYNKGLGFSHEERQRLNVIGLLPPAYRNPKEQLAAVDAIFGAHSTDLARYFYLRLLRIRHEQLYFSFITERVEDVLPIIYTPTVGAACVNFSKIYPVARGLFVSKFDKGNMMHVVKNWPERRVRAVCITDGERILGLGDLGAHGMGISVGKLDLYTALGKIPPEYLMPVCLDVGTNNEQLLSHPLYIGVREKRLRGAEYDELVQELMDAIVGRWGAQTLIHFEDFATPNAFKFIKKYQHCYCYFNDDIQGTAATGLAGLHSVERITNVPLEDHTILFVGAGSACLGISSLLLKKLMCKNHSEEKAAKNIYICDEHGLMTKHRKVILPEVNPFLKEISCGKSLEQIVEHIKPSILLGATGKGGIFTEKVLRLMGKHHNRPVIFAFSNPTKNSECTAEQAYNYTEGRALFCSGSPFPPVVINGKRLTPGQSNNSLAFPGIALASICAEPYMIPDDAMLVAARALADFTSIEDPKTENIFPKITDACEAAFFIAVHVAKFYFDKDLARVRPAPDDLCAFLKSHQYHTDYMPSLSPTWKYPKTTHIPITKDNYKKLTQLPF